MHAWFDFTGGSTLPAVESLSVDSTTFTSITITWSCSSCKTANITGYRGSYTTRTDINITDTTLDVTANFTTASNTFSAQGLIPRTTYIFQVAAYQLVDANTPPALITGPSATITTATAVPPGMVYSYHVATSIQFILCGLVITELGFFLGGVAYPNNSVVALDDIGDDLVKVGRALYCLTNKTSCCRGFHGGSAGDWFLPGATMPVIGGLNREGAASADFTRVRAPSAARLNRRMGTGPSGVYTCVIPDASGQNRTLYIGVDTGTVM